MNSLLFNNIAKVAKKPGKTNYLQYVNIPQIEVSVVDCPGYGHASKSNKEIKNWAKMLEEYISNGK
jgi:GTP-binding protein EngB required for normal cell division